MDDKQAKDILDKVVGVVFGFQNPFSLDQTMQKFAFDYKLPQQVFDSVTSEPTWAKSTNPTSFMKLENVRKRTQQTDWMEPLTPLNSIEDIISAWSKTRYMTTERQIDSINVGQSDTVYGCENVYRSCDVTNCKNIIFCDTVKDSEYIVAGTSSQTSSFGIRIEDSQLCSNSFNVNWSAKVTNSLFVQDCYDISDCMFCSHISGKRFCVANMQVSEAEYKRLKDVVVRWVLTS